MDKIQVFPEGEYDLTPKCWTKHFYRHNLVVFADGTGIYRAIPREKDAGTRALSKDSIGEYKPGGTLVYISQNQEIAVISGSLKYRKTLGIYEIIFYSPGQSRQK